MSSRKEMELSEEELEGLWGYRIVDEWEQSPDFNWIEGDSFGKYLQGTILQRNNVQAIAPVLDMLKQDLKQSNIIDQTGKPLVKPVKKPKQAEATKVEGVKVENKSKTVKKR